DLGLPRLAEVDDLLVGAAHEVPPHDDLLPEGPPADEHGTHRLLPGLEADRGTALGQVRQLGGGDTLPVVADDDGRGAGVDEQAVLVRRVEVQVEPVTGLDGDLRGGGGRPGVDGGGQPGQRAEVDPDL